MPSGTRLGAMLAAVVIVATAAPPATAASADACSLLTPAQVGTALGVPVGAGTYVTPTFKKTCTWTVTGGHEYVTLMLEDVNSFDSGKVPLAASIIVTPASGVGDDAYYLAVGPNVGLIVKKGNVSFKVAVYASDTTLDKKKALEKALAQQVVSGL